MQALQCVQRPQESVWLMYAMYSATAKQINNIAVIIMFHDTTPRVLHLGGLVIKEQHSQDFVSRF